MEIYTCMDGYSLVNNMQIYMLSHTKLKSTYISVFRLPLISAAAVFPANTGSWHNVVLTLGQRRRLG